MSAAPRRGPARRVLRPICDHRKSALAPARLDLRSDRDVLWPVVRVTELWRYPVKSLQGERLDVVNVGSDGLEGDRRFAIYDLATGFGLTARRVPELLFASARLLDDDRVEITLPDGSLAGDDQALSNWLGRRVELRSASAAVARRYENVIDSSGRIGAGFGPMCCWRVRAKTSCSDRRSRLAARSSTWACAFSDASSRRASNQAASNATLA
jgi:MOSC N-terminal beta barrel domain